MRYTHIITAAIATAGLVLVTASAHAQGRSDDRGRTGRGDARDQPKQVPPQVQQQRQKEQQQRDADYQKKLNKQVQDAQAHAATLQSQKRNAQYAAQQRYTQNLQQQQQRLQTQRDYTRDPYYSTPANYRYKRGTTYYQTNQYGADVLRQAVSVGYQQGVEAGRADRTDRVASNYQASYAYQDANYGFNGNYVPQADYNYYFREGFRRGYQDGYGTRAQYGTITNGTGSILGNILTSILGLQSLP